MTTPAAAVPPTRSAAALSRLPGRIARFLFGPLPLWARGDHPVQQFQRGSNGLGAIRQGTGNRARRLVRAFGVVAGLGVLFVFGLYLATGFARPAGSNPVEAAHAILYFPLIGLQLLARLLTVSATVNTVSEAVRRGTWDSVRATERGAELNLRARWAAAFYRVRGLLGLILALRVGLLLLLVWDLTAFQGRYIDLLLTGITPDVGVPLGILLLAALMTAGLLLPVTGLGLDAALGLLISTLGKGGGRTGAALGQGLYILVRVALVAGLILGAERFLGGAWALGDGAAWLLLFALGALGDWGLAFLYLERSGEIWATVPYGVLLGLALLVFALVQAFVADQVLNWAARRAQRNG